MESLLDKIDRLEQILKEACMLVGEIDERERLEKLLKKACNLTEDIRDSIEEMVEFAESISGVTPDEFGDFYDYEFEKGDYLDQGDLEW